MLRQTSLALLLVGSIGLTATGADAHPRLQMSNPAAGATLKMAPKEIRMNFSEGLVPRFSGLELKDSHGKLMQTGTATLNPNDNTKLIVAIKTRLMAGSYSVAWHAVSVDTHRVSGKYSFKVAR